MAETRNKPLAQIEQDLGLSAGLIRQWQHRYRIGEGTNGDLQPNEERKAEAEIRRLCERVFWLIIGAVTSVITCDLILWRSGQRVGTFW